MGAIRLDDGKETRKLIAGGRLTIRDASALKGLLEQAFDSTQTLLLDLSGAESLDLACAQVLCSANITFRNARKTMSITGHIPDGIRQALNTMAISEVNCEREGRAECLWDTGGRHEQENPECG